MTLVLAMQDSSADTMGCSEFTAPAGCFPGQRGNAVPGGWDLHSLFSSKSASVSKTEWGPICLLVLLETLENVCYFYTAPRDSALTERAACPTQVVSRSHSPRRGSQSPGAPPSEGGEVIAPGLFRTRSLFSYRLCSRHNELNSDRDRTQYSHRNDLHPSTDT